MRPATIVGVSLLAAAAGAALAITLEGAGVRTALAIAAPCGPSTSPPVVQAHRTPAARATHAASAQPGTTLRTTPAAAGAAPRLLSHTTLYASAQHLGYSWRTSATRWLGGTPASTASDRQAAVREGWWGEVEPAAPARVTAQR
jgi:hypothetical protein